MMQLGTTVPREKVLFYLVDSGRIIINSNAPRFLEGAFVGTGVPV
jgi:hypothetical protein